MDNFEYYYNNVPGKGLCRNNLIYTSLISKDRKTFCQWFHNDTDYHRGQNQIVKTELMQEKWDRETKFLIEMAWKYPDLVPKILEIDHRQKKIYLEIDGEDFWQRSGPLEQNYDQVLPDWKQQMIRIFTAHKSLGIYKYSLHPSSYFIVGDRLKSINYFFCYTDKEPEITIKSVLSHISQDRQSDLFQKINNLKIDINKPTSFKTLQLLAFESFKNNYPEDFMEQSKKIYDI